MPSSSCLVDPLALEEALAVEESPVEEVQDWDSQKLSQIPYRVLRGHCDGVSSCCFCFGDEKIISCSTDRTAKLWDVAKGTLIQDFGEEHTAPISECSLTADNRRMITSSYDKTVKAWDLETGKVLWSVNHEGLVTSCNISSDGKLAVSAVDVENAICVIDVTTGSRVAYVKDHHKSTVTRCCFDPDNQRVCSVSSDRTIKLWDTLAQSTTITINKSHDNIISDCNFSLNGRLLCTASWDKTLKTWDIKTGAFRSHGPSLFSNAHEGSVSACAFSDDASLLVSGAYDKSIVLWNVDTACKKVILKGHEDWVTDVALSSNKKLVLSACKCEECGKPFSLVDWDDPDAITRCVFCRLASPERIILPSVPIS
ncbi:WD repeat-containing protein 88 isoform X2 [Ambystoma mexicanum]|uniref:WD repeat-containing protein 88 isoform X2 n=1 Tax=Ambystoma mexicanum TaxID=8296 RepID=UPI0037E9024C